MKSRKFYSSFKKNRCKFSKLFYSIFSFRSRQKEFNKQCLSIFEDLKSVDSDIINLLHDHDSSINFLEVLYDDLTRRLNLLRLSVILLSISVLSFFIFNLF